MASVLRRIKGRLGLHPRALLHALLTYPRFLGRIKPALLPAGEQETVVRLRSLQHCWEPARLHGLLGRRLLVLAPHPDDEAIGVGGLLLAHRGRSEVHVVNLFNGEGGGRLPGRPWADDPAYRTELVAERRKEMAAAAKQLGVAAIYHLDLRDGLSVPSLDDAGRLRALVDRIRPDAVLLPWLFDNQRDHRVTNVLYAWACADLVCPLYSFEIWTLCQPNCAFDITPWLEEKLEVVGLYRTQLATVNYLSFVRGLAHTRAFHYGPQPDRGGAAEALFALPSMDYCDLVTSFYGRPGSLSAAGQKLL